MLWFVLESEAYNLTYYLEFLVVFRGALVKLNSEIRSDKYYNLLLRSLRYFNLRALVVITSNSSF